MEKEKLGGARRALCAAAPWTWQASCPRERHRGDTSPADSAGQLCWSPQGRHPLDTFRVKPPPRDSPMRFTMMRQHKEPREGRRDEASVRGKHTLLFVGCHEASGGLGSLAPPGAGRRSVALFVVVRGDVPHDGQELGELDLLILVLVLILEDVGQVIFALFVLWEKTQHDSSSVPKCRGRSGRRWRQSWERRTRGCGGGGWGSTGRGWREHRPELPEGRPWPTGQRE